MRYTPEHKEETRGKIIAAAAAAFRKHGVNGVGVAQLMKAAKLTHGGFYAHFESKDALIADALDAGFDQTMSQLEAAAAAVPVRQRKQAVMDVYVTRKHRDHPEAGCAIAALGSDVSRLDADTKRRFEARIDALIELIAGEGGNEAARASAIRMLATMVGGMVLARAVRSEAMSLELLEAVRDMR
ncbi:TetR/AcrR family transcriptional regulator [Cupriavidus sp. CuC1]|uniref:TetR/AcrR family transcriptional regulator n=1 Tax=Cupriavidus sp. CuC1 TaxID=3373131 RepID=UPI0037D8590B